MIWVASTKLHIPQNKINKMSSSSPIHFSLFHKPIRASSKSRTSLITTIQMTKLPSTPSKFQNHRKAIGAAGAAVLGSGFLLTTTLVGPAVAVGMMQQQPLLLAEPSNALSLPTWAIHVSSVVEWIIAMGLVWEYGEKSGYESWKGLSWGMLPLLGGAFCACTWHFFYNAESLEVLVALQAALTVIGNATMCIAAFRIYKSVESGSEKL